jgi:Tfp pilus assembly protein PilN
LPINFVKSRLAPPKQNRFGRTSLLVAAAVVVVLCGIASVGWDLYSKSAQLDEINQRHDDQKDRLKLAQATIDRTNYARGWYDKRTPALDVLKAVTNAFPQVGDVWATTISVHENGKGLLSGRAVDQPSVLRVIDAMKRDKRFNDVTLMDMRDAGASNKDTVFSLTFTFNVGPSK